MNCRYVESRLSSYVDEELTGFEMMLVRRHLARCESCERERQNILSTKRLLSSLQCVATCEDFESRLMKAVLGSQSAHWWERFRKEARANWFAWSFGLCGLAAAVVIWVVPEQRDLFTKGPGSYDAAMQGGGYSGVRLDAETRRLLEDHYDRRPDVPDVLVPERHSVPVIFER